MHGFVCPLFNLCAFFQGVSHISVDWVTKYTICSKIDTKYSICSKIDNEVLDLFEKLIEKLIRSTRSVRKLISKRDRKLITKYSRTRSSRGSMARTRSFSVGLGDESNSCSCGIIVSVSYYVIFVIINKMFQDSQSLVLFFFI